MTDTSFETPGVLNLADADTSTFDAIPAGKYKVSVWDVTWDKTKNPDGTKKMPDGTPMLKVQLRLDNDEHSDTEYVNEDGVTTKIGKNRTLFDQFVIPPATYDADKAAKMKGSLVNFLVAIGYDKAEVMGKKFKIDTEDMKQREAVVVISREQYPKGDPNASYQNNVRGWKPISSWTGASSSSSGLL